jgi:hypothetical protein
MAAIIYHSVSLLYFRGEYLLHHNTATLELTVVTQSTVKAGHTRSLEPSPPLPYTQVLIFSCAHPLVINAILLFCTSFKHEQHPQSVSGILNDYGLT